MANVVVVGTQWGDEGKGKIIDLLTPSVGRGGALPGRRQRRSHGRDRRSEDDIAPRPLGHPARAVPLHHRQRRGARSHGPDRRDRRAARAGVPEGPEPSGAEPERAPGAALPSRHRPAPRAGHGRRGHRHHRPRHRAGVRGSRGARGDPRGRPRGDVDLRAAPRRRAADEEPPHRDARRQGAFLQRDPAAGGRVVAPPLASTSSIRSGSCTTRSARASASSSRARRARRSTSITAPIPTSPPRTRSRALPAAALGSGPR